MSTAAVQTSFKEGQEYHKCRITLVNPGASDSVIDVYPSEHDKEKIWLDNTNGIERWEAIERMLNNFAERGTRVPKPAKWHNDGKYNKPDLNEDDIPCVRLDGTVLAAPPKKEEVPIRPPVNQQDVDARFKSQNEKIDALATAVTNLANAVTAGNKTESVSFKCSDCPRVFLKEKSFNKHVKSHHK